MALPTKVHIDGWWAIDPGTGDAPVYCTSALLADQLLAAILANGEWEITFHVRFGGPEAISSVTRVKRRA